MNRILGLTIITSIVLSSCFKEEYDFSTIDSSGYNPTVAAAIVNTELVLGDLIEKNDSTDIFSTDNDNLIKLTYASDLFDYSVADLVNIPSQGISQSFGLPDFSVTDINQNTNVTLGDVVGNMSDPEKTAIQSADGSTTFFPAVPPQGGGEFNAGSFSDFNTVTFYQGALTIDITNNWPVDLTNLQIEIRNVGDNSLVGTTNYPIIAAGGNGSDAIDLSGVTMSNSIKAVIVSFSSPGSGLAMVPIDLAATLVVNVQTSGLGVLSASAVFPSQNVLNQSIPVNFALTNGEQLSTLILKGGEIAYDIDYGIREDAQLIVTLPYVTLGGLPFSQTLNINSDNVNATNVTGTWDLTGYTFDLTEGGSTFNAATAQIQADVVSSGFAVPIDTADGVSADITIQNLDFQYIEGYMGNQTITVDTDTLDFGFFESGLDMTISLADPSLTLRLENSIGIPVQADLSVLSAISASGTTPFGLNPSIIDINYPAISNVGGSEITDIVINNSTSNIGAVLSSNPSSIIYGMGGQTNAAGVQQNFVLDTSRIKVSMEMEVPLYGGVSGLVIRDTLEFPTEAFENVKTATLRTNIISQFPVESKVQMYFLDNTGAIIDSLFSNGFETVVPSSTVDGNGDLVATGEKTTDVEITEGVVENIKNADKIAIAATLATANNGATNAKFYAHHSMKIKLGVKAKVIIDLKED